MMNKQKKKTTSEKPVSLSPLSFKEALKGLLGVKPNKEVEKIDKVEEEEERKIDQESSSSE